MNTNSLFRKFNKVIRLDETKHNNLNKNRNALRDKIKEHFKENNWDVPKFYPQGSFPLRTNLNPIQNDRKYDLDYGVYIFCREEERLTVLSYHSRILNAVNDITSISPNDKNTCVRVNYADGHHIDLPIYWMESEDSIPKLAHKSEGYIVSDPKAFGDWVNSKISQSATGQLRRLIRYLKAWKDYKKDSNIKLPSGFILTILACKYYCADDRDDMALKKTIEKIEFNLKVIYSCHRPTVPTDEELLSKYDQNTVMTELNRFITNAQNAIESNCEKEASEYWRKSFGDRFQIATEKSNNDYRKSTFKTPITKEHKPWLAN